MRQRRKPLRDRSQDRASVRIELEHLPVGAIGVEPTVGGEGECGNPGEWHRVELRRRTRHATGRTEPVDEALAVEAHIKATGGIECDPNRSELTLDTGNRKRGEPRYRETFIGYSIGITNRDADDARRDLVTVAHVIVEPIPALEPRAGRVGSVAGWLALTGRAQE